MLTTIYSIYPIKKSKKFIKFFEDFEKQRRVCEIETNSIGVIKKFSHHDMGGGIVKEHRKDLDFLCGCIFASMTSMGQRSNLLALKTKSGLRVIPVNKNVVDSLINGEYDEIIESEEPISNIRDFLKVITI